MSAIKLPVHAYQISTGTLWNIRDADNDRLAVELTEEKAKEIERALNVLPALVDELNRLMDCVGETDVEIIRGVLARAENVEAE